jgi:2-polyprenyl-3-methyl-5-hydroxy-6-metoxy-1,4-benzoquinol methylase
MHLDIKSGEEIIDTEALKNQIRAAVAERIPLTTQDVVIRQIDTDSKLTKRQESLFPSRTTSPDNFFGGQKMSLDEKAPHSGQTTEFSRNVSSVPLLGPLLNWTFKILALPARFYALQQDFSNRAAWIDQHGDHVRQNQYQLISRQTQIERSQMNLEQLLRQLQGSLSTFQNQFHQFQSVFEQRLLETETRQRQSQTDILQVQERTSSFEASLHQKQMPSPDRQNALDSELQLLRKQVRKLSSDFQSALDLSDDAAFAGSKAVNSEGVDIDRLKEAIRHRVSGQSSFEAGLPLKRKLAELQQHLTKLDACQDQIEARVQTSAESAREIHSHIARQSSRTDILERNVSDLIFSQGSQRSETEQLASKITSQADERQRIGEMQSQVQSVRDAINTLQGYFEQVRQQGLELSNELNITNLRLSEALGNVTLSSDEQISRISTQTQEVLRPVQQQVEAVIQESQRLDNQIRNLSSRMEESSLLAAEARHKVQETRETVSHELEEIKVRVLRTERRWRQSQENSIPSNSHRNGNDHLLSSHSNDHILNGNSSEEKKTSGLPIDFDYFLFEHRFRGSRDLVKARQSVYADFFAGRQAVIDLGCGRGEFLELLKERGITAVGIDANEDMVDLCRDNGLNVIKDNLLSYLQKTPDRSLDGAFSAQVIEHMSPEQIFLLLSLLDKKLKPGSPVVIETVNTNCQVALSNFFLDPTHTRPVPPDMLLYMSVQNQFRPESYIFSSPFPGSSANQIVKARATEPIDMTQHLDYALLSRST